MEYNWRAHWENNNIAFHLPTVNPLLKKYWPRLQVKKGAYVFVPLCGKTLDLLWLANKGYRVIGVELSEIACEAFFSENNLSFQVEKKDNFIRYFNEQIELYCGNFFELSASALPVITAVYDRAALMALPDDLRQRYAKHLLNIISNNSQILLIIYDSPDAVQGPPYPLSLQEIKPLFSHCEIMELERLQKRDISKHLLAKGYKTLDEVVYLLQKKL